MLPRLLFSFVLIVLCSVFISSEVVAGEFAWNDDTEKAELTLTYDDKPVIRYMYAYDTSDDTRAHETYKVYHHVFGPDSGEQITKGPHGQYTHHRGMYVGWNKTRAGDKTYDFWHCKDGAHSRHAKVLKLEANDKSATMTTEIHWNAEDGKPVVKEERTVTVTAVELENGKSWQIDWSTKLASQMGDLILEGDRQHAGFQYRAAQAVAEAESARYVRPEGFPQEPDAHQVDDSGNPPRHIDLNWFAMTYPLGESQYTVEYFEAHGQPHPSLYSERPYGRFGAYYRTEVKADQPLEMKYRLFVSEGETPTQGQIQARYNAYVGQ
ncbi:MAG: PmoA family protein [Planctomycetaceae bacterium]|nr:PmoA family protein [Planctomycetaceae bacterium]